MKKMTSKDLIDFRRKSDRRKKSFVERIKSTKIDPPSEGGGNYWISSISAACSAYKQNDIGVIDEKIDELLDKLAIASANITKNMYQRNISILRQFKSLNIIKLRPKGKLTFLKKSTGNPLLTIKGLQVEAKPSLIYTFEEKGQVITGGIWFVSKVGGYTVEEVGLFCDVLNRFLKTNYSKKYALDPKYCIAVDLQSGNTVKQLELDARRVSPILLSTLDEINKLL